MPTADATTCQQLLTHQLMGLPTKLSTRLQTAGEINNLGQLIQHAKLLMAINAKRKPEEMSVVTACAVVN